MNEAQVGRHIVLQGLALILIGLVWGFVVPHTPYPRLALTAHIEFEQNGLLLIALGVILFLFRPPVARVALIIMLAAAWLIWPMLLTEVANAWWGTNQVLTIAARQAGAVGATSMEEMILKLAHIAAGLGQVVTWTLLFVAFARQPRPGLLDGTP
jgi:hydroxylaminobenzene mutase